MSLPDFFDAANSLWVLHSLAHVLWQGALIAGVAAALAAALRSHSAPSHYAVYCLAMLLTLACVPLNLWWLHEHVAPVANAKIPSAVAAPSGELVLAAPAMQDVAPIDLPPRPVIAEFANASSTPPVVARVDPIEPTQAWETAAAWLLAVYLLGATLLTSRLVAGLVGCQRLRWHAQPIRDGQALDLMRRATEELGLRVAPIVSSCARVTSPVVVGVLKPAILLPAAILSDLTPAQVESLLLHELAHIKRYDHLVNLAQRLIEAVLFFHPAVWWLSHRISVEREHCCDDLAIRWGSEPCNYAESLVRVSELRYRTAGLTAPSAAMLAASGGRPTRLKGRVLRVLGMPGAAPSVGLPRAGVALLVALTFASAALMAALPDRDDKQQESSGIEELEDQGARDSCGFDFKSGGRVELIAIGDQQSSRRQWWTPHGAPLAEVDWRHSPLDTSYTGVQGIVRTFIYRTTGAMDQDPGFSVSPSRWFCGDLVYGRDGQPSSDLRAVVAIFEESQRSTSLFFRVGDEPAVLSELPLDWRAAESDLPTLAAAQRRRVRKLVEQAGQGRFEESVEALVDIGPAVAREMTPLLKSGPTDRVASEVLKRLAPQRPVQRYLMDMIDEAARPPRVSPNTIHCGLIALGASKNAGLADYVAKYLETKDLAAMSALGELGGEAARDHLIGAFDVVPTERWFVLAGQLERVGDKAALPELRRRLAVVELPPSESFPNATVGAFTQAIVSLSGEAGGFSPHSYVQGVRFRYPYDGPGLPKTFSVNPPNAHYVNLPEVDSATDEGRDAIWKAMREATDGAGFTLDGGTLVLFNGLRASPLWPEGRPYPTTLYDWLRRTSHRKIRELVEATPQVNRISVPDNGVLAALDPGGRLYVLSLKRQSGDDVYAVNIWPQDPSMQLVATRVGEQALTELSSCTLYDLESEQKDGALNLSRGHMLQMTEDKWNTPGGDAILVAEFVGNEVALAIPGAERFVLVPTDSLPESQRDLLSIVSRLQRAVDKPDQAPGHRLLEEDGGIFHVSDRLRPGQVFLFAVQMPGGLPVAGVLQIDNVDRAAETVKIRHQFFSTQAAKEAFLPQPSKPEEKPSSDSGNEALHRAWHAKQLLAFSAMRNLTIALPEEGQRILLDLQKAAAVPLPANVDIANPAAVKAWAVDRKLPFEFHPMEDGFSMLAHDTDIGVSARTVADQQTIDRWPETVDESGRYKVDVSVFDTRAPRELMQSMFDSQWAAIRFNLGDQGQQSKALQEMRNQRWTFDSDKLPAIVQFWDSQGQLGLLHIESYDPQTRQLSLRWKTVTVAIVEEESESRGAGEETVTDLPPATQASETVWDKPRRGWQVGARLLSTTQFLKPGDPVVVQYLLKNAADREQTIVLQQIGATHPTLGEGGRISMNISGNENDKHRHLLPAGGVLEQPQYRVVLSTQGMLPGEYYVDTQPAFWSPKEDEPNSATGLGRNIPVHFTLGVPSNVEFSQPPVEADAARRIHWGQQVSGLVVGMRLPAGRKVWPNDTRIEAEMFLRNVSDRTIEFEYEIPAAGEWNMHVQTADGRHVRLERTWYSGWRQRNPRPLSLRPGEQAPLATGQGPAIRVLKERTTFNVRAGPQLISDGGQYTWKAYVTIKQNDIPDLTMVVGSGVAFEIGEAQADDPPVDIPKLDPHDRRDLGVRFRTPEFWTVSEDDGLAPKVVRFEQPDSEMPPGGVQATLAFRLSDNGGPASIDTTSPPSPEASEHRIFTVDGVPARLTCYDKPNQTFEDASWTIAHVQFAKENRSYHLSSIFPTAEKQRYLKLLDAVCASIQFLPSGANTPTDARKELLACLLRIVDRIAELRGAHAALEDFDAGETKDQLADQLQRAEHPFASVGLSYDYRFDGWGSDKNPRIGDDGCHFSLAFSTPENPSAIAASVALPRFKLVGRYLVLVGKSQQATTLRRDITAVIQEELTKLSDSQLTPRTPTTTQAILASLKRDVVALSEEFPVLNAAKDIEVANGQWVYQSDCRDSKQGYEDTGPMPVAIGLRVMTAQDFQERQIMQMRYPGLRWEYLGLVGWQTLHVGDSVSTELTNRLQEALRSAVVQFGQLNREALNARLPAEIRLTREQALATADEMFRSGLRDLAKRFPQLEKAPSWERLKARSGAGRIAFHLHRSFGTKKGSTEKAPFPASEAFSVLVVLKQPPDDIEQLVLSPLYPTLGLVGRVNAGAPDNPELDAALKKLVADAILPISELEQRAKEGLSSSTNSH